MNNDKPGWRTTEFWLTFGLSLVAVLKAIGAIPRDDSTVEAVWRDVVFSTGLLVAALVTAWKYIQSRLELKKARMVVDAPSGKVVAPVVNPPSVST